MIFFIKGARKEARTATIMYALMYSTKTIKMVQSDDLVKEFPEKLVSFLENLIAFKWPDRSVVVVNQHDVQNTAFISACTNYGGREIKYLVSRHDNQFLRVASSSVMVKFVPDVVVRFLESKIDFGDCHPLPFDKRFSKFFQNIEYSCYSLNVFYTFISIFR